MKGYIKLKHCEYKIFNKRVKVSKKGVLDKYKDGAMLIYVDNEEYIEVCAVIHCDYSDMERLEREISDIELPELSDKTEDVEDLFKGPKEYYKYLCVVNRKEASKSSANIVALLARFGRAYVYGYYINMDVDEKTADTFLVAGCLSDMFDGRMSKNEKKLEKDYGVMSVDTRELFENVTAQIREWLRGHTYNDLYDAVSSRVIGQENLKIVLTNIYMYLLSIAEGKKISRNSFILAAPSGCGKTETYRAIKDYLKVHVPALPVDLIDTNQITGEGFIGKNTNFIVRNLKGSRPNGVGIVFLDEFDKRLIPIHTSHGDNMNREIQGQLLLAIEGAEIDGVDTNNTMFIGLGSFNVVRERKAEKAREKKFGLGVERGDSMCDHYQRITREDMVELGASYELIGRFTCVIDYDRLPGDAIDRIIDVRLKEISDEYGVTVSVSNEMRNYIHENSNAEFGNRLIRSVLLEGVVPAKTEILMNRIDAGEIVVTGKGEYLIRTLRTI